MAETKQIDPAALGTLTCGTVLCDFALVAEAAEWLLGHPVWTHEFVTFADDLRDAVVAQFPDMPVAKPDDWAAMRDELRARHGATVAVARGNHQRSADPVATLRDLVPDAPIIVITDSRP